MKKKIEVGDQKHAVEYANNPYTGIEEIKVNGETVVKKFCLMGMERTVPVGNHSVRVKSGFLEQMSLKPMFFVDGLPVETANVDAASPLNQIMFGITTAAGIAVGFYAGLGFVFVMVSWGILAAVLMRPLGHRHSQSVALLFTGQSAYVLWLVMGFLFSGQPGVLADIILFALLTGLILAKPSAPVFIAIMVFQGMGLIFNVMQLFTFAFASAEHKGIVSHFFVRVCIMTVAAVAFLDLGKHPAKANPA
jgi:hypothetical protein